MLSILKRNNRLLVKIIILITIAIPVGITVYEIIFLQKDNVLFLGDYPPAVAIIVIVYYCILLVLGILWIVMQLKNVLTLKNENRKNELLHLQSQVNPHFFFNMLNNLYGLIDVDAKKAKALILKLSDLMRYSIYEGERTTVTLEEEIEYLNNYIELHKMRYHKGVEVIFNSEIDKSGYQIMPLLFIILVENAFKHGVENLTSNAFVHINLIAENGEIDFEIKNNFDNAELPENSGIGIQNLKRRLMLVYPKAHQLIVDKLSTVYKAKLELTL